MNKINMNKYESLVYLRDIKKLNTPDFNLVKDKNELSRLLDKMVLKNNSIHGLRISTRTMYPGAISFNTPFFPNRELNRSLIDELTKCIDDGYNLIVAEAIDPNDTLFKGNFMMYPSFSMRKFDFMIEFTNGSGTCRDLETSKKITSTSNIHEALNIIGYPIQKIFTECKGIFNDLGNKPIVVEWSIYDRPIGIKKKSIIYWEVRDGINICNVE